MRLTAIWRGWVRSWIRRRQGPDRGPVTLRRGRSYIVPTGLGLAVSLVAVAPASALGGPGCCEAADDVPRAVGFGP